MSQGDLHKYLYATVSALCLLTAPLSYSAEWTTSAGVAPGLVYTDNYCLENDNEQDEWIATVTPNLGLQGTGRRVNLNFTGSFQFNNQDGKDDNCANSSGFGGGTESFLPRISANSNVIVIEQWLFLDASATASQNTTNSFRAGGSDGLNGRGNTNTSYNWTVSPYIQRRFKNFADVLIRYTYDEQYNTEDIVDDSVRNSAAASISSVPGTSRIDWTISGSYSDVDYDDGNDFGALRENETELISADITIGYRFSRKWRVYATYGDEWNDFISVNDEDIDGSFWAAGFNWTPNNRLSLQLGTGDRYFGSTPTLDFRYTRRRSAITASYSKQVTYSRDIRSGDQIFQTEDLLGNPLDPITNEPVATTGPPTTLTQSPVLDERGTLNYNYSGRRNSLGISGSYSEQLRADIRSDTTFIGVSVTGSRSLNSSTSLSGSLGWSETQSDEDALGVFQGDSEEWRFSLSADRTINEQLTASLAYQFTDRDSELIADEYTENRVTFNLRFSF